MHENSSIQKSGDLAVDFIKVTNLSRASLILIRYFNYCTTTIPLWSGVNIAKILPLSQPMLTANFEIERMFRIGNNFNLF